MSFAQIHRLMKAMKLTDDEQWRKVRRIAYEVWRKGGRNPPPENVYMPISFDEIKDNEKTDEELDEIWRKYGKLRKN